MSGQFKDEALRNAKIKYLGEHKKLKAHPYFWGGIYALGDMSPILD